jgi:hypothetical protein
MQMRGRGPGGIRGTGETREIGGIAISIGTTKGIVTIGITETIGIGIVIASTEGVTLTQDQAVPADPTGTGATEIAMTTGDTETSIGHLTEEEVRNTIVLADMIEYHLNDLLRASSNHPNAYLEH